MCKAQTPTDWLREYQEWATGAFERMTADAWACQRELMTVTEGITPPLVPSQSDVTQAEAKERERAETV
jgi:hypothetical protein